MIYFCIICKNVASSKKINYQLVNLWHFNLDQVKADLK